MAQDYRWLYWRRDGWMDSVYLCVLGTLAFKCVLLRMESLVGETSFFI